MILLDAYALVAFLGEEPAAAEVEELLRHNACAISTVNLAEAIDISIRVHGVAVEELRQVIGTLVATDRLAQIAPDDSVAWRAAGLRGTYYKKRTCELSLADCFLLASAGPEDSIATADPPVTAAARNEGLTVIGLPDSAGRRA